MAQLKLETRNSKGLGNGWKRELQVVAAGVAAAAAVELLTGARRTPKASLRHMAVAAGVATAYAHLVPAPSWGARSGAAFAQMPMVAGLQRRGGAERPLELALWGGLTGLLLHWFEQAVQ